MSVIDNTVNVTKADRKYLRKFSPCMFAGNIHITKFTGFFDV